MEEVERGYIPNELVKKRYSDLGIEIDDLSEENYEPKEKNKFQAFTRQAKSLGMEILKKNYS